MKVEMSSIGVTKVQVSYVDGTNTGTLGQTSSAALIAGKNAKLNRVIVIGGARIEPVVLSDQNAKGYNSTWSISTYDNPIFMQNNPNSIQTELRNGMVGLGYMPAQDLVGNDVGRELCIVGTDGAATPVLPSRRRVAGVAQFDRGTKVEGEMTILEGAFLTVLIVFLFLHSWRSTVITGLTLPIALIGTFLFMYAFGFTINTITLMALSLCVGLLIDDAIVVRENIVRHAEMGKPHRQAALDGTQEIALAVLATTLGIVAVFMPLAFWLRSTKFYQVQVFKWGSVLIALLALYWFVQRAFDL